MEEPEGGFEEMLPSEGGSQREVRAAEQSVEEDDPNEKSNGRLAHPAPVPSPEQQPMTKQKEQREVDLFPSHSQVQLVRWKEWQK